MVKRTAMLLVVEVAAITSRMIVGRRDIVDLVVSVGVGLSGGQRGGEILPIILRDDTAETSSKLGGCRGRFWQDYTKDRPRRIVVVILGVISEIRRGDPATNPAKKMLRLWALWCMVALLLICFPPSARCIHVTATYLPISSVSVGMVV